MSTWRRCAKLLNSIHSTIYFGAELDNELARYGVADPMDVYFAGRIAPMGAAGPGVATAALNAFAFRLVSAHLPALWDTVAPADAMLARERAAGRVLERLLGAEVRTAGDIAEAAKLALDAAYAGPQAGRALYAANTELPVPDQPHIALWHATTLLREHRGDGHVIALGHAELAGLDALVLDCASTEGMPKELVMDKRGWTQGDWSEAENRLRDRGLMTDDGELTPQGTRLRAEIEAETDRLDRWPYAHLGTSAVVRLEELAERLVAAVADAGAFPPVLRGFFADL